MSIWATRFAIANDEPTGAPYEVDWPGPDLPRDDSAYVDVAQAPLSPGWIRLSLLTRDNYVDVVLDTPQIAALRDELTAVLDEATAKES